MLPLDRLAIVTSIVLLGNLVPGPAVVSAQEELHDAFKCP